MCSWFKSNSYSICVLYFAARAGSSVGSSRTLKTSVSAVQFCPRPPKHIEIYMSPLSFTKNHKRRSVSIFISCPFLCLCDIFVFLYFLPPGDTAVGSYSFLYILKYIETKDYFSKASLLHLGLGRLVFFTP